LIPKGLRALPKKQLSSRIAPKRPRVSALVAGILLLLIATTMLARVGYYTLFSIFQDYDDEGTMLISILQFVKGKPLYSAVFSLYGPFYYWFHWLLFRPGWFPLSHDTAGLLTIGLWLASCAVHAFFVWRATGRPVLALVAEIIVFRVLNGLPHEPAHPQALCVLLVSVLPLAASCCTGRMRPWCLAAMGAIVGALFLTKINVGLYALAAVSLSLSAVSAGRLYRYLGIVIGTGILLLPMVLMRAHLGNGSGYWHEGWAFHYAAMVTIAALPMVAIHWRCRTGQFGPRIALIACGACFTVVIGVSAATIAYGTSMADLLNGVVLQHRAFATITFLPPTIGVEATLAATASVMLFLAFRAGRGWWHLRRGFQLMLALALIVFGANVLWEGLHLNYNRLLSFALPFAWLAALPAMTGELSESQRFTRLLLVALAIVQGLVAYPVAGTQFSVATVLLVPVAALCMSDGLRMMAARWAAISAATESVRRLWLRRSVTAVAGAALLWFIWLLGSDAEARYESLPSGGLAGGERLHMEETQLTAYGWLSCNLQAHSETFITMPGLNSLYFWTAKEPPTTWNTTHWMTLFDNDRQQRIVEALTPYPRLCAVRNAELTHRWLRGQSIEAMPLVRSLDEGFQTIGSFAGYEFRIRRDRAAPELLYCVQPRETPRPTRGRPGGDWNGSLILPPISAQPLARVVLAKSGTTRILADSQKTQGTPIHVLLSNGNAEEPLELSAHPLDLATGVHLKLHIPLQAVKGHLVLRLLDAYEHIIGTVPVLE
jgi:hypothetical protein